MIKNKNQSGKAALIILISILVIGLISVGGYFAWTQYFNNAPAEISDDTEEVEPVKTEVSKTPTDTETTIPITTVPATTPTNSSQPQVVESEHDYFIISQWGIKGYYNGKYVVEYNIINDSVDGIKLLQFTTPDSPTDCQGRVLYKLKRYLPTQTISSFGHIAVDPEITASQAGNTWSREKIVLIGSYYYVFDDGETDSCSGGSDTSFAEVESDVGQGLENFFKTLVAE